MAARAICPIQALVLLLLLLLLLLSFCLFICLFSSFGMIWDLGIWKRGKNVQKMKQKAPALASLWRKKID